MYAFLTATSKLTRYAPSITCTETGLPCSLQIAITAFLPRLSASFSIFSVKALASPNPIVPPIIFLTAFSIRFSLISAAAKVFPSSFVFSDLSPSPLTAKPFASPPIPFTPFADEPRFNDFTPAASAFARRTSASKYLESLLRYFTAPAGLPYLRSAATSSLSALRAIALAILSLAESSFSGVVP